MNQVMSTPATKKSKKIKKASNKQKVVVQVGPPPLGQPSRSPGFVDTDDLLSRFGAKTPDGRFSIKPQDALVNPYLACVLDAKHYTSQLPDVYNRPTAIYQQIINVDIKPGTATGAEGRFTCVVVPHISGGPLATNTYSSFAPRLTLNVVAPSADVYATAAAASTAANYTAVTSDETVTIAGYTKPTTATTISGLAMESRPVAQYVWAAFVGDTLEDGGSIAAAIIPDATRRFFDVGSSGQYNGLPLLQNWETLAKLPGAYSGPIRTGSFTFWRPQDVGDNSMRTNNLVLQNYDASNVPSVTYISAGYPGIIVSGKGNVTAGKAMIRLEIVTVYEYVTTSRVVPSMPSRVNPEEILQAAKILEQLPQSMSNANHSRFILDILRAVSPIVSKAAGPLAPLLSVASAAGLNAWDKRLKGRGL